MDSRSIFQNWIREHGVKCITVYKDEGGIDFKNAVTPNANGLVYLIKSDRTYENIYDPVYYEDHLINAGCKPHVCSGADTRVPEVLITAPSSGSVLNIGSKKNITWTANDNVGVISRVIMFSSNNGVAWALVDSANENSGNYLWNVPAIPSKTCKIKIAAYDAAKNKGIMETGVFEIKTGTGILHSGSAEVLIECRKTETGLKIFLPFSAKWLINITDIYGKSLSSICMAGKKEYTISTNQWSSGVYILLVKTSEKIVVRKFISM